MISQSNVVVTSFMFREEYKYEEIVQTYCKLGIYSIRVNCSRFTNEDYCWQIEQYRKYFSSNDSIAEILLDLPCPGEKYRVFFNEPNKYSVEKDREYTIKNKDSTADGTLQISDTSFFTYIHEGDLLIVGDGEVEFLVISCSNDSAVVTALNSGSFTLGKSLTNTTHPVQKHCSTEVIDKFKTLIHQAKPDGIILSFCNDKKDILYFRDQFQSNRIIPKIETATSVENLKDILNNCQEVLLGRGDLGIQNRIACTAMQDIVLETCKNQNKSVIVGTGILSSLENGCIIPTRAEMTDIHYLNKYKNIRILASAGCASNPTIIKRFVEYSSLL